MPLYFFNLEGGAREEDETGTDFADDHSAGLEAIRFAGEVLRQEPHRLMRGPLRLEVCDSAGAVRFVLDIGITAPGIAR